ncbi:hypothetical protein [Trichococcus flocculiformis]|uniref:hypothetical protein n=1 Tax=Trichococcus flocculiformis TaxID=82803 RepID=UPI002AAB275F|nr:hypothetical protein [Trichococcus flocculiformis]
MKGNDGCTCIFFRDEKALEHENRFNALLNRLEAELVSGNRKAEHEKQYAKYFETTKMPKCGTKVTPQQEVIT